MNAADKLQAAIAWLGERWILHPSHAPQNTALEQRTAGALRALERMAGTVAVEPPEGTWEVGDE